jgi:hypothetical protein
MSEPPVNNPFKTMAALMIENDQLRQQLAEIEDENKRLIETDSQSCKRVMELAGELEQEKLEHRRSVKRHLADREEHLRQLEQALNSKSMAEWCLEERAAGNGGCGACSVCCKELRDEFEQANRERDDAVANNEANLNLAGIRAKLLEKAGRERELAQAKCAEWADLVPEICQLLDGWHADGTAWSEWDESVRKRIAKLNMKPNPGQPLLDRLAALERVQEAANSYFKLSPSSPERGSKLTELANALAAVPKEAQRD